MSNTKNETCIYDLALNEHFSNEDCWMVDEDKLREIHLHYDAKELQQKLCHLKAASAVLPGLKLTVTADIKLSFYCLVDLDGPLQLCDGKYQEAATVELTPEGTLDVMINNQQGDYLGFSIVPEGLCEQKADGKPDENHFVVTVGCATDDERTTTYLCTADKEIDVAKVRQVALGFITDCSKLFRAPADANLDENVFIDNESFDDAEAQYWVESVTEVCPVTYSVLCKHMKTITYTQLRCYGEVEFL